MPGPYSENFALLRFGGTAWSGIEQWSCGLKLKHLGGDAAGPMHDEVKATIDEVTTACQAYVGRNNSKFSWEAILNWVTLNVINKDTGKYYHPNDPTITEGLTTAGMGGSGVPQLALAVTMRGDFTRGTAAFGRWFIPAAYMSVAADGNVGSTNAQQAADSAGTFLTDLANIDSGLGPDAWAPWLYGAGASGARDSSIAQLDVGRVYDTQRRRRNSLEENYVTSTTFAA